PAGIQGDHAGDVEVPADAAGQVPLAVPAGEDVAGTGGDVVVQVHGEGVVLGPDVIELRAAVGLELQEVLVILGGRTAVVAPLGVQGYTAAHDHGAVGGI